MYVELNLHLGKQNKALAAKEIGESYCWCQGTSGNVFYSFDILSQLK